jgi:hypothetical protein
VHHYVEGVISAVRAAEPDGRGGLLRIKSDADREQVIDYLTRERNAAQARVDSFFGPPQLNSVSTAMQALILTELLLAEPDKPVDLYVVSRAQSYAGGQVAEHIEEAADDLVSFAPRSLEVV